MSDALDDLAGIAPGSPADRLRRRKPITRDGAQATYDGLFAPDGIADFPLADRVAVAVFVAGLHGDAGAQAFYAGKADIPPAVAGEIARAVTSGPFGRFPAGPLSKEDEAGMQYTASPPAGEALGARLAAALEHAHMLVFHPRDAAPAHIRKLEAAGWSADAIVTLSQLVAFLSFQLRAAHGLRILAEAPL